MNPVRPARQISAPIQPGSSGGPVFDHYGNAVAVIVSTATAAIMANASGVAPQNMNFAIKASIARSFLDANGIGADGQTPPPALDSGDQIHSRGNALPLVAGHGRGLRGTAQGVSEPRGPACRNSRPHDRGGPIATPLSNGLTVV
jgi:S1-C subfamily serine protease